MKAPKGIPKLETAILLAIRSEAQDLGLAHKVLHGAWNLAYGLTRAKNLLKTGETWAPHLVKQWQDALREYCAEHEVELPGFPDV